MIIDRLVISNFKNYAGENEIDLSVDDERNLILIGGFNGFGKTTMAEAIRICLYGSKFAGKPMSDSKYQEYLESSQNYDKRSKKDRFYIEMDVKVNDGITSMELTIVREFTKQKNGFEEILSLTKNGNEVEIVDRNYWEHFVEKIIPPRVLNYFFFDGEKTTEVISSPDASDYLSNAVSDITGITELRTLKEDLIEVKKRISRSGLKTAVDKKVKGLELQISEIKENNLTLLYDAERYGRFLEEEEKRREKLTSEMNRALGAKETKCKKIGDDISSLEARHADINDQVYEFASSVIPFFVSGYAFKNTIIKARKENEQMGLILTHNFKM